MKLIRFGQPGSEKPGLVLQDGRRVDTGAFAEDYDENFFATRGIERLAAWLKGQGSLPEVAEHERWAAPICRPSKIVCIGLNYAGHARESGMEVPAEPVIFFKATSAMVGPNDDVLIPRGSEKTDWEVELGVVIGEKAAYVSEADAMKHIAGYVLHNDYSERAFQLERAGQWVKGKSCDTFAPVGPWLAAQDEIPNPHKLRLWLKLNGEILQDSNTDDLIFNIPFLISYLSSYMTLLPGDLISTGTPAGVGLGLKPPVYLKEGDVVELGIDGLGTARQRARAYR